MTVSENVVPGGPGHSKHHNDLAKQSNELEQIVTAGRLSETELSATIAGLVSSDARAVDDAALARLAVVGQTDRSASVAGARYDWETAPGWTEDFANLTPWIMLAGAGQVSGGKFYANGGGTGARRSIPGVNMASDDFTVTAVIDHVVNTTSATGHVLIGITSSSSADGSGISGNAIRGVGVNDLLAANGYNGATWTAGNSWGSWVNPLPSATYYVSIVARSGFIIMMLFDATGTLIKRLDVRRSDFTPTGIMIYNTDSRGTSGTAIRSVVVRKGAATGNPRGSVERTVPTYVQQQVAPTNYQAQIVTPAGYDSRKPLPFVIYCHGYTEDYKNVTPAGSPTQIGPIVSALVAAGYGVVMSDFSGLENWGNSAALTAMRELYAHLRANYPLGPIGLIGHSMGSLVSLTTIAQRSIPGIAAWYGIEPACNLDWLARSSGYAASVKTAHGVASDLSDYATKTAGKDPLVRAGWEFRGLPMRIVSSPGDTAILESQNADKLAALVGPFTQDLTRRAATGNHTDASHFDGADVVAFFNRTLVGGV